MMAQVAGHRGRLLKQEPMSKHCSWRTGGVAEFYYEPADKQDLADFLAHLDENTPITWVGLGSNLLVREGGIRGVVIGSLNRLKVLTLNKDGSVYAECGVSCAKLARYCQQHQLAGADFLAGIPGTVGGALAMNAGAFGSETWQFVVSAEVMNRRGEIEMRDPSQFDVSYRSVSLPADEWFSAACFRFDSAKDDAPSNIKSLLEKRNASQPIGLPSCGSVFKNPPGDHAARLIEKSGLKGYCIGGACVSEKHANFIINHDHASASDIENLIAEIQQQVREQQGVLLQTEVRIIGEQP